MKKLDIPCYLKNLIEKAAVVGAALFFSGCLAPKYQRPTVEIPPAYKEHTPVDWKPSKPSDALPRGKWWEMFGDARLSGLEEKVNVSNQNVLQAAAQFREARSLVTQARSNYFPSITTNPSASRQLALSGANNAYSISNNFSLPVSASWEPDIWGQTGYEVQNVAASAQASAALFENMRLSMQAELASDYFAMEELDMEGALLSSATASYADALELTINRYNSGIASQADVAQAQTQLDSTRAQMTDLSIVRAQNEHAVAVLVGQSPSSFSLSTGTIQGPPPAIPTGLPAQLLERRPDIASAERLVAAANANIGLARTAYFPIISLTATGGFESNSFAQWFLWPSRIWALGAQTAGTLLDFGRLIGLNREAKAAYDSAVAGYRQTVLGGFQEVEDNLAALSLLAQEADQQDAADKGAEQSLQLEIDQYKGGVVSYLNVITTQNIALTNERTAVQILGRRMTAAVTLIRALGGGWNQSQLPTRHDL